MNAPRRLAVFCGSASGFDPRHAAAADQLAAGMLRRGWGLVYGGASIGLMGRIADALLQGGGEVIGVLPRALADREIAHSGLHRLEIVGSMHERKARMVHWADAFAALPGGFGTLDELCEIITWRQLGIHKKPVAILDAGGFYRGLLDQIAKAIDSGFIRPEPWRAILVDSEAEVMLDRIGEEMNSGVLGASPGPAPAP